MSDFVRDGIAATLLLVSLGLPWNFAREAGDLTAVVLITILSVLSLFLPYLGRLGVFPPTWTVDRLRITRLLLNAPYLILVIVYLVIDVVEGFTDDPFSGSGGVGAAAWVGLAGAVLAAQPRAAETDHVGSTGQVRLWHGIVVGLTITFGCAILFAFVRTLLWIGDLGTGTGEYVIYVLVVFVLGVGVFVPPLLGTVRRGPGWRLVLVSVGVTGVLSALVQIGNDRAAVESVHLNGYTGALFWMAAAAAASSPAVRMAMQPRSTAQIWLAGARSVLTQTALVAAAVLVALVAALVFVDVEADGTAIFTLVAMFVITVLSLLGRQALNGASLPHARGVALVLSVVVAVTALVNVVVRASLQDSSMVEQLYLSYLLLLTLPVAALIFLTVPTSIRTLFAGTPLFGPTQWAPPAGATNIQQAPLDPHRPASSSAPGTASDRAMAADLATAPQMLADLAFERPDLRPIIAENPSTYPELVGWLGRLGDPAVDAALSRRRP